MPVVLLVRHGQASFGADDYDQLSEIGIAQSRLVGAELAVRGLRDPVIVHGTLRRQRNTASLALEAAAAGADEDRLDVDEVRVDGRWDEYDHLDLLKRYVQPTGLDDGGDRAPMTTREMQVLLDSALLAWVEHGDDGGWPLFSGGAADALTELIASLDNGQDAVAVTSGGVIAATCARLLGLPASGVVALNRVTANGGITKLIVGSSGTTLVTFNEHAHLEPSGLVTYR